EGGARLAQLEERARRGGGLPQLYAYVRGHVLKAVDPLGLCEGDGCGGAPSGTSEHDDGESAEAIGKLNTEIAAEEAQVSFLEGVLAEREAALAKAEAEGREEDLATLQDEVNGASASLRAVEKNVERLNTELKVLTGASAPETSGRDGARQVPNLAEAEAQRDAQLANVSQRPSQTAGNTFELGVGGVAALGLGLTLDIAVQWQGGGNPDLVVRTSLVWGFALGVGVSIGAQEEPETTQTLTALTPMGGISAHQSTDQNLQNHFNGATYSKGPGDQWGVIYSTPGMSLEGSVPLTPVD
ncbi:MAG: hypothetical protein MK135_09870, partial [Polyangiaceae bacterium]|nr:hypothetical protein [Polyangiaceae bacterium]